MKKVLVIGGTRFFGKRLVYRLIEKGYDVTIATRGITPDSFGMQVHRIIADRWDIKSFKEAIGDRKFDIVYDNICFSPQEAAEACEIFKNRTKRYIFTSTMAVYELGDIVHSEADFDPYTYPIKLGSRHDFSYGEGKKLAEAVFFQANLFPVVAVRFPLVIGTDDYTERLAFHIEHVLQGETMGIPKTSAKLSLISSEEAGGFLAWLAEQEEFSGPINASNGVLSLQQIVNIIEDKTYKKANIVELTSQEHMSPYGMNDSYMIDPTLAHQNGYRFSNLPDWFPELVQQIILQKEGLNGA